MKAVIATLVFGLIALSTPAYAATKETKTFGVWKVDIEQSAFDGAKAELFTGQTDVLLEIFCLDPGRTYTVSVATKQAGVAAIPDFKVSKIKYKIGSNAPVDAEWDYFNIMNRQSAMTTDGAPIVKAMAAGKGNLDLKIGLGDYTFALVGFKDAVALLDKNCRKR